jgi:hypothetical protein
MGGGLPHTAKCRVSPRASCRELSVGTCRCVVLLWLCTPALFLLPACLLLVGGTLRSRQVMAQGPEGKTARTRLARSSIAAPRELGGCRRSEPCLRWSVRARMPCRLAYLKTRVYPCMPGRSRVRGTKRHNGVEGSWNQIMCSRPLEHAMSSMVSDRQ